MKFCRHFYTDTLKENLQIFSFLECTYTVKKKFGGFSFELLPFELWYV